MDKVCSKQNRVEVKQRRTQKAEIIKQFFLSRFSRAGTGLGDSLGDLVLLVHAPCHGLHIKPSRKFH